MLVPVTAVSNWKRAMAAAALSWPPAIGYAWFATTQPNGGSSAAAALALPLIVAPFLLWSHSASCALAARALWWGQMLLGFMLMDAHRSLLSSGIGVAAGSAASLWVAGVRGLERGAPDKDATAFRPLLPWATILALGDVQVLLVATLASLSSAELTSALIAFAGALAVLATSLFSLQAGAWKIAAQLACCVTVLILLAAELVEAQPSVRALLMGTSGARAVLLSAPLWGALARGRPVPHGSGERGKGEAAPVLLVALLAAMAACWIVTCSSGPPPVIYSYDVHELLARHERGRTDDALLRVTGTMVPGSSVRFGQPCQLSFRLRSLISPERELEVHRSSCDTPHTFHDNRPLELHLDGRLRHGSERPCFEARSIMVRMSKYEMKERP